MATYEVVSSNVNNCDVVMPISTPLGDKVKELHELISDANGVSFGMMDFLFGAVETQENAPNPPANCMNTELDIMLNQMRMLLDRLCDIRNRLG